MRTRESEYAYERNDSGEWIPALEIVGEDRPLTVKELRDFLNLLIEEGYGDYEVEADTQDGSSYDIRDEVLVFNHSKIVRVF